MPRRPRIVIPEVPLHLIQRGINRTPIFFDDADYRCFLRALLWASSRTGCALHAYVLMNNHVHVLLTPGEAVSPVRMMQSIGALYVGYINQRYARTGGLWERRYRSSVVASPRYFLACSRYIELNPVRAGLAVDPSQFRWSSYHRNALGRADPMLVSHPVYQSLGKTDSSRQEAYRLLLQGDPDPAELEDLRAATRSGIQLGGRLDRHPAPFSLAKPGAAA